MVEFGAGGNITQATDLAAAGGDEVAPAVTPAATGGGATPATAATATPAATPAATQRRKRKAKGWFCPVCRQRKLSKIGLPVPLRDAKNGVIPSVHLNVKIDNCSPSGFGQ
jgi:hypothetical protein